MTVGAFARGAGIELTLLDRSCHHTILVVKYYQTVTVDFRQITFLQKDKSMGFRQQGGDIGCDEVFTDAHTDDQGAAGTADDDRIRIIRVDGGQRIGALQRGDGFLDRGWQAFFLVQLALDHMGDDFGICFRHECVAICQLPTAQLLVVFDDAVVHDATLPRHMCGWALALLGMPCVAQRVWAMPMVAGIGAS